MKKLNVGILGATGMVGQRLVQLLSDHPYFKVTAVAASSRSSGKLYSEAVEGRWHMSAPTPKHIGELTVLDAVLDIKVIATSSDFVFSALDMEKTALADLEEQYAKFECPVISTASAHRFTADVPMVIPEINPHHFEIIPAQRRRLGTHRGFIVAKPNCSVQSFLPAIYPLLDLGVNSVMVSTYQAVSGAGKTVEGWAEMQDNVTPYIGGEEEKTEREPLKILGSLTKNSILNTDTPTISAQCVRVPVSDGHLATVCVSFDKDVTEATIIDRLTSFSGEPQRLKLPSAPGQFITYFNDVDRPQTKLDRDLEGGMGISVGRLRRCSVLDYKFVCLSHNTLRGAGKGAVLTAELLYKLGYLGS